MVLHTGQRLQGQRASIQTGVREIAISLEGISLIAARVKNASTGVRARTVLLFIQTNVKNEHFP